MCVEGALVDSNLVVKYAPEMAGVWKHICLPWKVGTTAVHHVHTRQVALRSDLLQPQVLLCVKRIVGDNASGALRKCNTLTVMG